MSNPTSNFGWQMPTPTDLVTDLPADFEVFGQAVDSTMADLKGGTSGQILSKNSNTDMDFVWTSPNPGDITGVTAGTGISGGGTSGDVTITNSMATAIDAKGDLIGGTGADAFARLAVGTNGQVLTADSAAATGLAWTTVSGSPTSYGYAAGKNAILNGDFSVNQRNFTSTTTNEAFGFDRWLIGSVNGTTTYTAQTFTPGTAPVSGYEGTNFARLATTGQGVNSLGVLIQRIENARTFAGQTVTVSFWAKAASGTPQISTNFLRSFGTGGSPSASEYVGAGVKTTLSTSWARYSQTISIPSVSGKTFGTNPNSSYLALYQFVSDSLTPGSSSLGAQNVTIDFWGMQVEAGSTASTFQTATGTIQGELAACQRYFYRAATPDQSYGVFGWGMGQDSTAAQIIVKMPQTMRILPSSIGYSTVRIADTSSGLACTAVTINANQSTRDIVHLTATVASGSTQYRPFLMGGNNSTSAYVEFNSEL